MGSPLTYYFFLSQLPGATTPYLHLDPHLVWATSDGALGSKPPFDGCGCATSDGWQVYLTAMHFYVELADPSDGLSSSLLRSHKLLSPSSELGRLRYG
jgi:hypothetical protein